MLAIVGNAILEQLIQNIVSVAWNRPETERFRTPIETVLRGNEFKLFTQRAFQQAPSDLPYFDAGYIAMPQVQAHLSACIVKGDATDLTELARLYAKGFSPMETPPADYEMAIVTYLKQLREVFEGDASFGPILLARDMQRFYSCCPP